MSSSDLEEDIAIQLECMEETLVQIGLIVQAVAEREPTQIETAAAAGFIRDLYGGVENMLKRICLYAGKHVPSGPQWHQDLLSLFGDSSAEGLPALFEPDVWLSLDRYREFRHVATHGYGVRLDWSRMAEAVFRAADVFTRAMSAIRDYVDSLPPAPLPSDSATDD